ncbi:siderophore iron transporter [Aspergillus arachidicola]|uniref:Siderophore iron transporter n=1 Tax=Aspergillus arachidicola TaxID=656916 RepID=A0A2G7FVK7_9EURO|nr:siderophore iron transporter [Aspergillus arachidicola]
MAQLGTAPWSVSREYLNLVGQIPTYLIRSPGSTPNWLIWPGAKGAVSKPFIAKISDITSRPYTYTLVLFFYVLGYIIVATCRTIAGYVVGDVFVVIGSSGLDLTNDIIVTDLTPLEWRGFARSMLSTPFIINTSFVAKIVDAIDNKGQWRWAYGMFAIVMPVALGPAIATLIYLDRKAKQNGIANIASSNAARRAAENLTEREGRDIPHEPWVQSVRRILDEIDALGLILLGFGWSLLLLPLSLKTYADGGWRDHSLIAMMIIGGLLLITYVSYEVKWARVPSAPRRLVFNKTFTMAIIIDSFYMRKFFQPFRLAWIPNQQLLTYCAKHQLLEVLAASTKTHMSTSLNLRAIRTGSTTAIHSPLPSASPDILSASSNGGHIAIQIAGLLIKISGLGIMLDRNMATANTGAW